MQFRHRLLYGTTGQGKSTLLKGIAQRLDAQHQIVIVFNPLGDDGWPPLSMQAMNVDQLEHMVNDPANYGAHVLIDEAIIYRKMLNPKRHKTLSMFGSIGRHQGMTLWVAAQYPTAVDTNLRWNCGECYCFKLVELEHAKAVWSDYGCQSIDGVPVWDVIKRLNRGEYVHLTMESAQVCAVPAPR